LQTPALPLGYVAASKILPDQEIERQIPLSRQKPLAVTAAATPFEAKNLLVIVTGGFFEA